jgi:PPM family protein phosphatase
LGLLLAWSLLGWIAMKETTSASSNVRPLVAARPPSVVRLDVSGLTHPGHVRTNNEDHFLITKATRALETIQTSLPPGDVPDRADEVNHVMVLADGMGGHAAGEVASRLAISALVGLALQIPDWIFWADTEHAPEMERRTREAVQQVGSMLIDRGRQDAALRGMGSTLTAARSCGRDLLIVHVGDSRAYLFRAGRLERLTRDHTYAQMLVDAGQLSPSDVTLSRFRHILINALGGSAEQVAVDVDLLCLENGDRLLLCSDGLTDGVDDETIAATLSGALPSSEICHQLVQRALDSGGRDNITVIVAMFEFPAPGALPPEQRADALDTGGLHP